jgi:hypothetical protein
VFLWRTLGRNLRGTKSISLDARDVHPSLKPSQMQSTVENSIVIAAERKQSTFIDCITAVSEGDVLQAMHEMCIQAAINQYGPVH